MATKNSELIKVKTYMLKQNRPYSVNDIFLNLHKEIGKSAVQKYLDQLTAVSRYLFKICTIFQYCVYRGALYIKNIGFAWSIYMLRVFLYR